MPLRLKLIFFMFNRRLFISVVSMLLLPSIVFARNSNDPQLSSQWYLNAISAPSAWNITTGSKSVIVAVLDTGLDLNHEDIIDNLWTNSKEIAGNRIDDDKNGYIDDVHGWDFVGNDADPSPRPSASSMIEAIEHGTLLAGLFGAVGNNNIGMAGVNWKVSIMPVRMLNDQGAGKENDAANAIRYAVDNGARVINLSFVGNHAHAALASAIQYAFEHDVVVVAALGNEGLDTNKYPVYPACLRSATDDWVIGVTAVDEANEGTSFTNYGSVCADIAAPGTNIRGLSYYDSDTSYKNQYNGPWSGSSMASPLVAGAAALLFSKYPTLSAGEVRNILKLSVDPIQRSSFAAGSLGAGRLNVFRALQMAASYAPSVASSTVISSLNITTPLAEKLNRIHKTYNALQYSFVVFGAPNGADPMVGVYRANGKEYAKFQAYASNFKGGVRVATINNDSSNHDNYATPEIVTGAGEGGGPHVRVFKASGALSSEFFAYDKASDRGVNIAVGDVNGDGINEIITAVGSNVSRDVVAWSERGVEVLRFKASHFSASSPLEVMTLNTDHDSASEIAVTGIINGVINLIVYDNDGKFLFGLVPDAALTSVSMSHANLDGTVHDNIIVSALSGSNTILALNEIGALVGIIPSTSQVMNGNRVVGIDLDLDGVGDIIAMENIDGGKVSIISSDLKTLLGSFTAPSFGGAAGPFLSAW